MDEAAALQAQINRSPARGELLERGAKFGWRANGFGLAGIGVAIGHFAAGVRCRVENVHERYSLAIPLAHEGEGTQYDESGPLSPRRSGIMVSPGLPAEVSLQAGYEGIQVVFDASRLESALDLLTETVRPAPLRFELPVDLRSAGAEDVRRILDFMIAGAERERSILNSPLVQCRLEEALLFSILLGLKHNYSHLMGRPVSRAEPVHLRRAEEYIAAHAHEALNMTDIAHAAGVSVRALSVAFRSYRGCSPMAFVRAQRYERARTRLLSGVVTTVSEVAFSSGFEHLGRFSVGYRERFGETPKQTLGRALATHVR